MKRTKFSTNASRGLRINDQCALDFGSLTRKHSIAAPRESHLSSSAPRVTWKIYFSYVLRVSADALDHETAVFSGAVVKGYCHTASINLQLMRIQGHVINSEADVFQRLVRS